MSSVLFEYCIATFKDFQDWTAGRVTFDYGDMTTMTFASIEKFKDIKKEHAGLT